MGVIDMCFELNRLTFFIKVISCVKMLVSNNTPNVQAPLGVSLLHPLLIIEGYQSRDVIYPVVKGSGFDKW
jgi:hypothetical protein